MKIEYSLLYGPDWSHRNHSIKRFDKLKDAKQFVADEKIDLFELLRYEYKNEFSEPEITVLFQESPEHRKQKYNNDLHDAFWNKKQGLSYKKPEKPIELHRKWSK